MCLNADLLPAGTITITSTLALLAEFNVEFDIANADEVWARPRSCRTVM